ncbi:hypothetical protein EJB05_00199, partial [Eragrostis curvula]
MGLGLSCGRRRRAVVDEVDPVVEWKQAGADQDVVEILLPGFKKEQVRVQVDEDGVLRAAGERPAARGGGWVRFRKDFLLPETCDVDGVRAEFIEKLVITLPLVGAEASSPESEAALPFPLLPATPPPRPPVSPEVPPSPPTLESPPVASPPAASPQAPIYSEPSPSPRVHCRRRHSLLLGVPYHRHRLAFLHMLSHHVVAHHRRRRIAVQFHRHCLVLLLHTLCHRHRRRRIVDVVVNHRHLRLLLLNVRQHRHRLNVLHTLISRRRVLIHHHHHLFLLLVTPRTMTIGHRHVGLHLHLDIQSRRRHHHQVRHHHDEDPNHLALLQLTMSFQ